MTIDAAKSSASAYTNRNDIIYPTKWYQGYANAKQLGGYLDLCVRSLRYLDGQGSLQRNNALFLIACLKTEIEYAKYGYLFFGQVSEKVQNDIATYIANLNNSLTVPLEDNELAALIKSALQNKYHYRAKDTIQKKLNLTDEEFADLGWMEKQRKEAEQRERVNAAIELDKEVVGLYLDGLSDAKIAAKLGITKRTSINIRQRLGVTDRSVQFDDVDFEGNKRHATDRTKLVSERVAAQEKVYRYEDGTPIRYSDFFDGRGGVLGLFRALKQISPEIKGSEDWRAISKTYYSLVYQYRLMEGDKVWKEEHRQKEREDAGKPIDWTFYSDKFGLTTYDGIVEHALRVAALRCEMERRA